MDARATDGKSARRRARRLARKPAKALCDEFSFVGLNNHAADSTTVASSDQGRFEQKR
jgi:hypothetical protein